MEYKKIEILKYIDKNLLQYLKLMCSEISIKP